MPRPTRTVLLRAIALGLLLSPMAAAPWWSRVAAWEETPGAAGVEPAALPAALQEPRGLPTFTLMHAKLARTQQVLAGLLRADCAEIGEAAHDLVEIAGSVPPCPLADPADREVYEHFRQEFVRQAMRLEVLAEQKNLEGAAWVHGTLTATCLGCHEMLRDGRPAVDVTGDHALRAVTD